MITTSIRDARYKKIYDSGAVGYDHDRFTRRPDAYAKRFKNELIVEILDRHNLLAPATRILDVPSGTGRVTHTLLKTNVGHICAADISPEMLRVNEGTLTRQQRERVRFVEANMKQLPVEANSFDAAVMASFFYLVPSPEYREYIRDVCRALRPGGILIAEISNALPAYNPKNLAYVLLHKHFRRQAVKSYVYCWQIRDLFFPLVPTELWGVEFPLIGKTYHAYRSLSKSLMGRNPWKLLSGKFTVVLQKNSI